MTIDAVNADSPGRDSEVTQPGNIFPSQNKLTTRFNHFEVKSFYSEDEEEKFSSSSPIAPDIDSKGMQSIFDEPDKFDSLKWVFAKEDLSLSDDPSLDLNHQQEIEESDTKIRVSSQQVRLHNQECCRGLPKGDLCQPGNKLVEDTFTRGEVSYIRKPKKPGRKKIYTGLRQRKDVILKKVLRRIRGYFWKRFNEVTKYNTRKRSYPTETFFNDCIKFFMRHDLKIDSPAKPMVTALGNIMWIKEIGGKEENEVYQVLYKFSFKRFTRLARNSNFKYFVRIYAKNSENFKLTNDEKIALGMILKEC